MRRLAGSGRHGAAAWHGASAYHSRSAPASFEAIRADQLPPPIGAPMSKPSITRRRLLAIFVAGSAIALLPSMPWHRLRLFWRGRGGQTFHNRLQNNPNVFLASHAGDAVDWRPWGDEAFDKARREDKPIFLTVGFTGCVWCIAMQRESFRNPEIAALINHNFVPVLMDRGQHPRHEDLFLHAAHLLSGQSGYPLNVLLTPQLQPFFATTYIPPRDSENQKGLTTLLRAVSKQWRSDRAPLLQTASRLHQVMKTGITDAVSPKPPFP